MRVAAEVRKANSGPLFEFMGLVAAGFSLGCWPRIRIVMLPRSTKICGAGVLWYSP